MRSLPDERHHTLVPAMGNLHSHAFNAPAAGLAEVRGHANDSFELAHRHVQVRLVDDA